MFTLKALQEVNRHKEAQKENKRLQRQSMSAGTDTWAEFFEKLKARVQQRYLQDNLAPALCAMLHQLFES
jgi:hypothetical protein